MKTYGTVLERYRMHTENSYQNAQDGCHLLCRYVM
jgi:hypothetical protein